MVHRLGGAVDREIESRNGRRAALGKPPFKGNVRKYALLQEVTKAAVALLCQGITVCHTYSDIFEFSVTSFYSVGLEMGLVSRDDLVPYEG